MAEDPYGILGVKRDAPQDDVRKAYRTLARKLHPDLNPGDKAAEEKFKRVAAAYGVVGDADKRARFDSGEIDAAGNERPPEPPPRYYRDFADAPGGGAHPYANEAGFADMMDDALLAELLKRGGRQGGAGLRMRGQDLNGRLALDFLDAVNGATKRLTLPDGTTVDVVVPPGTQDGQVLRLRGKGAAGIGGGAAGDLLVELAVGSHPNFERRGDDIHLDLPIGLREAVLGGKVAAPTPAGTVTVNVPKGSNTGSVLRLRGRGVKRADGSAGDAYATLRVMLPEQPDAALEAFVAGWNPEQKKDPRAAGEG